MSSTSQVQSGSRPVRLTRSRSQRVVRVLQTSDEEVIISTVNSEGSGPSSCVEKSFSFLNLRDDDEDDDEEEEDEAEEERYEDRDEIDALASEIREIFTDVEDDSESQSITDSRDIVVEDDSTPVFFEANTDDGSVYSFYPADEDDDHEKAVSADLFSDDEFSSINMRFQRRPPHPILMPPRIKVHVNKSLPPSPRSSHFEYRTYEESLFSVEAESTSCSTLYSMDSSATSATCVAQEELAKQGNCDTISYTLAPSKCLDTPAPSPATRLRSEVSLEKIGYDFGLSRFDPRTKIMRDMTSDPIDFKQYALSRGPNAFPVPGPNRPKLRTTRSNLEKRLIGVFKQRRVA